MTINNYCSRNRIERRRDCSIRNTIYSKKENVTRATGARNIAQTLFQGFVSNVRHTLLSLRQTRRRGGGSLSPPSQSLLYRSLIGLSTSIWWPGVRANEDLRLLNYGSPTARTLGVGTRWVS